MFFVNNKEEEFKLEDKRGERRKSRDSLQDNEMDRINNSILSKGREKDPY